MPIPAFGSNRLFIRAFRCASGTLFQSTQPAESVSDAPTPSICWKVVLLSTAIVKAGEPAGGPDENASGARCASSLD